MHAVKITTGGVVSVVETDTLFDQVGPSYQVRRIRESPQDVVSDATSRVINTVASAVTGVRVYGTALIVGHGDNGPESLPNPDIAAYTYGLFAKIVAAGVR